MGKIIPIPKRYQIIQSWKSGSSFTKLSEEYKVAYHTVRTLCKRFEEKGVQGIEPRYLNCGPKTKKSDKLIYRSALWLKRHHQDWGAPLIRLKLQQRYPQRKIPSERTFQNWFKDSGLNTPRSKLIKPAKQWAMLPHDVWQVDGKEEQKLNDGTDVCWLTVVDENSCGLIAAPAFQKKESTMFLFQKYS